MALYALCVATCRAGCNLRHRYSRALCLVETLLKKSAFVLRWQCAARRQFNRVLCIDLETMKMPVLASSTIFNYYYTARVAGVREAGACSIFSVQVANYGAANQTSGADNKVKLHAARLL